MRAAGYVRVSSKDQEKGYSPDTQRRDIATYCEQHGWELVEVYDDTQSGAMDIEDRPGGARMLADARAGRFDALIVWKLDRAFRDADGLPWLRKELKKAKVASLVSLMDPIPDGTLGALHVAYAGARGQEEREDIRRRSMAGVKARVRDGKLTPGNKPRYGFRWADDSHKAKGSYVEDPDTAWVVQLIFEQIAAGTPKRAIKRRLESESILAPRGGPVWSLYTIASIVRDRLYQGEAFAFRTQTVTVDGTRKHLTRKPGEVDDQGRESWVRLEGVAPALVDPILWQRANEALDRAVQNESLYNRAVVPEDVLVRGFCRCAHCGNRLAIHRYADGPYLFCQTRQRAKSKCPGCTIKASILDAAVWPKVEWVMTDPGVAVAEYKRQAQTERAVDDAAEFNRLIREAEAEESRYLNSIGDGSLAGRALLQTQGRLQAVSDRIEALAARRDEIEMQRLVLERQSAAVADWLTVWVKSLGAARELSYQERQERLRKLGVEVTVAKHGSELPRFEIAMTLPVDIEDVMSRDREGGFAAWTDEDQAEWERLSRQQEPQPQATQDSQHPSRQDHSSPSSPYSAAPFRDIAGGSPRRSRRGRPARSRW